MFEDWEKIYLMALCGLRLEEIKRQYANNQLSQEDYDDEISRLNGVMQKLLKG